LAANARARNGRVGWAGTGPQATAHADERMPREMAAWLPNRSRRGDEAVAEA
jgi:hypothetical protein